MTQDPPVSERASRLLSKLADLLESVHRQGAVSDERLRTGAEAIRVLHALLCPERATAARPSALTDAAVSILSLLDRSEELLSRSAIAQSTTLPVDAVARALRELMRLNLITFTCTENGMIYKRVK